MAAPAIPTIAEAAKRIAAKQLSPVELTRACLDRVRALDDRLHAFVHLTEERALAEAREAERAIMAGGPKGPLHGIPIGLKDIVDTKGIPTTCGSKILQDNIPDTDAACAEKLAAAGTVLIGKTTTHEFADGGPSFDLPKPPARNPWNTDHFTAGSSSGTGAAVAAGLILGGIGTDTGGSIRGPAALCGIAGIKPTYGLVSRAGVAPAAFSLDHIGPMAWTAEDCALMLQALAGHDPRDPASADRPVPNYTAALGSGIKGLKVGVIHHFHEVDYKVSQGTQRGIDGTISALRELGAEIREVQLSPLQDWQACGSLISITERASAYDEWARTRLGDFSERVQRRLMLGALVSGVDYVQAVRRRRELRAELKAAMAGLDIVLTAAAPGEAPKIDNVPIWDVFDRPSFTIPFNVAGYPAMSICAGYGEGGLPVAVQLVGKPFDEATLFRVADAFEKATPHRNARPALA
ncbi:MAG: Asp-tRNA(Asn)/Glu-tRNA(Gln) amidotransferase subunit GatA [Alphaproteobacteria bacterium]|nr:MAG: Asp-tRNA(Asn)/Glu-tRNA(Gln) amidotransferase subunit GatA [Alphaproteobacteria bacterium]